MTFRTIQNADLKVAKGWFDTRDRQRVHVSLIGASWINKTYWLTEAEQAKPETIERVKTDLQAIAANKLEAVRKFIVCQP